MRKIFFTIIGFFIISKSVFSNLKDDIIPTKNTAISDNEVNLDGEPIFLLTYLRDSIFGLLALIAIGAFIFIGARLVIARGNPEEFKKALMQFIYALVGLFVVAASWALVKLVSSLNF